MLDKAVKKVQCEKYDIKALGVYQNGKSEFHNFEAGIFDIRSISKTIMSILCFHIIEHSDLTVESTIYPILKDHIELKNQKNLSQLKKIQIKHCLNHTLGFDKALLMRQDIVDIDPFEYLNLIVNTDIVYTPGTHYLYSNAGFYLLSAVLQIYLKSDLEIYLNNHIFKPLNITTYKWERYGLYLAGATRLYLSSKDLMKFGQLLLQDGIYEDKIVISKASLDFIKSQSVLTPKQDTEDRLLRRYAYAHGLWLAKDEAIFFAHGTDSQMLIMMPNKKAIVMALSNHAKLSEIENILNDIMLHLD